MSQKSNKPDREQNRIKIDMNIEQITDGNLNVRWLRNSDTSHSTPGPFPY